MKPESRKVAINPVDAKNETLPQADHIANAGKMIPTPSTGSDAPHTRGPAYVPKAQTLPTSTEEKEQSLTRPDAPHSETAPIRCGCCNSSEIYKTFPCGVSYCWHCTENRQRHDDCDICNAPATTISITDRVSLRVDPNNPDHPMGCDDETMPGAYGKSPALKDYKQGYRDGLEQGLFDGKMDRQRADFAESKLEQLESIVRELAEMNEWTDLGTGWAECLICGLLQLRNGKHEETCLILRSRELTQPK